MEPFYQDDHTTLYLGDCREIVPQLDVRVDLLLSDPPYGIGWDPDLSLKHCNQASRSLHHKAASWGHVNRWPRLLGDEQPFDPTPWLGYRHVILWGFNHFARHLPPGRLLVWDKTHKSGKSVLAHGECAWMKGGHGVWIHRQTWVGLYRQGEENGTRGVHPCQKPLSLMRWCLTTAGKTGARPRQGIDTVLDPYCGSGTTLVAAKQLGKRAIGVEIVEAYAETTARRLEQTEVMT